MARKTNTVAVIDADNVEAASPDNGVVEYAAPAIMRFEGTTDPRVATKANGRTTDLLKKAMSSEGAARGGFLRDWLAASPDNTVKLAASALGVSPTRISTLVNGPTVKARYALRVNPLAVFKGMTAEELDGLRSILDDMGAGEEQ